MSLVLAGLPFASSLDITQNSDTYAPAQLADLQFTAGIVNVTVEQGGTNTGTIRVQNYGSGSGSANLTYLGDPGALTGMTIELSTLEVTDLGAGMFQDITVTVSAAADLLPLGPRRLDIALMNGTSELDEMHLDMEVVAPSETTTTGWNFFGLGLEGFLLSIVATVGIIAVVVVVKRR